MPASERRDQIRTGVVWDALAEVLEIGDSTPLDVLDIGGGTGGSAVRVADWGHRVTLVDPSPDALAALDRRAGEAHVAVTGVQGDLSSLLDLVSPNSFDAVLCHGVLEVVDDPAQALATLRRVLRPGGTLSLLVAQRHAGVIVKAMAGHFHQALELVDGQPGRVGRFSAQEITALLTAAGFTPAKVRAVRVFSDLVPGALLDSEPGAAAALVELERAVADRPEYLTLATQVHVLATATS